MDRAGPSGQRLRDRALALTIATFVLMTPPVIAIFNVPVAVFGIPLLHIYCFAVWLGAILLGRQLARRFAAADIDNRSLKGSDKKPDS